MCHAKDGNYKKGLGGEVDKQLLDKGKINLEKAAQSVGIPNRDNCGACHFFGGGGDAVKHGEILHSASLKGSMMSIWEVWT